MKIIKITNSQYSEIVVRKTLYWMSTMTEWTLVIKDDTAEVVFINDNEEVDYYFHQLLNDFKLREQVESKTKNIRDSIMHKVLASLDKRLSQ